MKNEVRHCFFSRVVSFELIVSVVCTGLIITLACLGGCASKPEIAAAEVKSNSSAGKKTTASRHVASKPETVDLLGTPDSQKVQARSEAVRKDSNADRANTQAGSVGNDANDVTTSTRSSTTPETVAGATKVTSEAPGPVPPKEPYAPSVGPESSGSPATPTRLVIGAIDAPSLEPKDNAPLESLEGVVPILPSQPKLPDVNALKGTLKLPDDADLRKVLTELIGTWRQVDGGNAGDYAEGGYAISEITFSNTGFMQIARTYDDAGAIRLTRQVDFMLKAVGKIVIGEANPPQASTLITKTIRLPQGKGNRPIEITPASTSLPANLAYEIKNGRLTIDGKIYKKVK